MRAFMLWAAVAIGGTLGLVFGDPQMRGAIIMLAVFIAVGAAVRLIDYVKKAPMRPCLDCQAGHHLGCCDDPVCFAILKARYNRGH